MSTDQTAIERLEHLLNEKDAELRKYRDAEEKAADRDAWIWTSHEWIPAEEDPLPTPRLQMECRARSDEWFSRDWWYFIVYKHFLGDHVFVPIGHTRQDGGRHKPIFHRTDLPFRDGVHLEHDAENTFSNWPVYVVIDGEARLLQDVERTKVDQ